MLVAVVDGSERLSYRELAKRFSISPDAARIKGKRRAKTGEWRIIPGNHSSDRVLVEVPISDLTLSPERTPPLHGNRSRPFRANKSPDHQPRTGTDQANAIAKQILTSLMDAQNCIRDLTEPVDGGEGY
jgi:hypothetical protein